MCGKQFEAEDASSARNSVVAHMAASTDDDHSGIGYEGAQQRLDVSEMDVESDLEQSSEQSDEAVPTSPATDGGEHSSAEQSSEQSPVFDAPARDESAEHSSEQSVESEDVDSVPCPHCGTGIEGYHALEPGVYRCGSCGDPFRRPAASGGASA